MIACKFQIFSQFDKNSTENKIEAKFLYLNVAILHSNFVYKSHFYTKIQAFMLLLHIF